MRFDKKKNTERMGVEEERQGKKEMTEKNEEV